MAQTRQTSYDLIWNYENQFAYQVAKQVLHKPKISAWLVLIPILFLYYAHKIQQYKGGIHSFSKGLMRTKIIALDSARKEISRGERDEEYQESFAGGMPEEEPRVLLVREKQLAEVEILKSHYGKLLREEAKSYRSLIRKAYQTGGAYRMFVNRLTAAEEEVMEAVLQAYHSKEEDRSVTLQMQKAAYALRQQEIKDFF